MPRGMLQGHSHPLEARMAAKEKTLEDLFHDTLKDIYFAEKKILTALPKMAKAAHSDELKAAFEKHHTETEGQVERLEQVFELMEKPARGKPGPKPKQQPEAAVPALSDADEQPAIDLDQPDATMTPALNQDDAMIAEMAYPGSADEGRATTSSQDGASSAKPAARWDRAADTVEFDWPEIERTAAQDGPNQVMAKLLIAARAEGANSRWPL